MQQKDQKPRPAPRHRHPVPVELEATTTVLEPADAACNYRARPGDKIGEAVSKQVDLIPAKLIVHRTVVFRTTTKAIPLTVMPLRKA